jgi:hypothetical protein
MNLTVNQMPYCTRQVNSIRLGSTPHCSERQNDFAGQEKENYEGHQLVRQKKTVVTAPLLVELLAVLGIDRYDRRIDDDRFSNSKTYGSTLAVTHCSNRMSLELHTV